MPCSGTVELWPCSCTYVVSTWRGRRRWWSSAGGRRRVWSACSSGVLPGRSWVWLLDRAGGELATKAGAEGFVQFLVPGGRALLEAPPSGILEVFLVVQQWGTLKLHVNTSYTTTVLKLMLAAAFMGNTVVFMLSVWRPFLMLNEEI